MKGPSRKDSPRLRVSVSPSLTLDISSVHAAPSRRTATYRQSAAQCAALLRTPAVCTVTRFCCSLHHHRHLACHRAGSSCACREENADRGCARSQEQEEKRDSQPKYTHIAIAATASQDPRMYPRIAPRRMRSSRGMLFHSAFTACLQRRLWYRVAAPVACAA